MSCCGPGGGGWLSNTSPTAWSTTLFMSPPGSGTSAPAEWSLSSLFRLTEP
jgi:hypothetical protein